MTKTWLLVLLLFGSAQAADPKAVAASAGPLISALRGIESFTTTVETTRLPGYGAHILGSFLPEEGSGTGADVERLASTIAGVVDDRALAVKGLDTGDWVSVSAEVYAAPFTYVVVRVKPDRPATLEVWIDGVAQRSEQER